MLPLRRWGDERWPLAGLAAGALTFLAMSLVGFSTRPLLAVLGSEYAGVVPFLGGVIGAGSALVGGLALAHVLGRLDARAIAAGGVLCILTEAAMAEAPLLVVLLMPLTVAAPPLAGRSPPVEGTRAQG